jgi:polysaccharide pyruvyl transferase WcaK-like protein
MVMKKIGILTFWGVPNYGAFAQAYALNKLLTNQYKQAKVLHLAYLHAKHKKMYFKRKWPKVVSFQSLLTIDFYKELIYRLLKPKIYYPEFERDWNSIPHVQLNSISQLEKYHCNVIVTGSDAIWEYSIPDFGDDEHLIGNRLNCEQLASYAASFGEMNPDDNFKPFVKCGLELYNSISVRDANSRQIVSKLLSKDVAIEVLDPTLLYDFKTDKNIPNSPYTKYILVYGYDFPESLVRDIQKHALANNLIIIGAGLAPKWCDICLSGIGPLAWIGLFKNAEFVVTCTFHGLMFSINYEKKVVFNQVAYVKNRSTTLLEKLDLYGLYANGTNLNRILNYNWNYDKINKKLNILRSVSKNFLESITTNE